jgi:RNA polymerase sigma-70 factor, ECF subfamily
MPFLASDLLAALPRLRRYAHLLIDDPACADAMVEETVRRVRQTMDEPPSGMTPAVEFLSMLRSVYADQFAPGRPRGPLLPLQARESSPPAATDSPGGASRSNPQRAEDLLAQIFRLPMEQREVLVLVAVERMSYEDTATLLRVPVATVFARLVQAREALRVVALAPKAAPKSSG